MMSIRGAMRGFRRVRAPRAIRLFTALMFTGHTRFLIQQLVVSPGATLYLGFFPQEVLNMMEPLLSSYDQLAASATGVSQ